ncbi:hypothetical protein [Dyadobacter sp. 676]|uniref:Uncharacterized protein n=1 Tax=Dyadobacter sp. 676 TaxID=3088362 RepID=A0AAU8FJR4_9BACT
MTLNEIRTEMVAKTERKIQEMKARSIVLPERRADMCELCDQLSQEIYDFAVKTTIQIADRCHLRGGAGSLLNDLHDDIYALTNGALDILVSASRRGNNSGRSVKNEGRTRSRSFRPWPFHSLCNWLKSFWHKPLAHC